MPQPDNLEKGIYFHQIRATPGNKSVLVVARGNNATATKPEDPGSLHVYGFKNGVLSNLRKIQPNGGYGYGPRHLDIHPNGRFVYLSVERAEPAYCFVAPAACRAELSLPERALATGTTTFPIRALGPIQSVRRLNNPFIDRQSSSGCR